MLFCTRSGLAQHCGDPMQWIKTIFAAANVVLHKEWFSTTLCTGSTQGYSSRTCKFSTSYSIRFCKWCQIRNMNIAHPEHDSMTSLKVNKLSLLRLQSLQLYASFDTTCLQVFVKPGMPHLNRNSISLHGLCLGASSAASQSSGIACSLKIRRARAVAPLLLSC